MLAENPEMRSLLRRMIARLSPDPGAQEDLVQEALIQLWRQEQRCPGQKRGWYLRGCFLHVMNLLRSGRSIDCYKHRRNCVYRLDYSEQTDAVCSQLIELEDVLSVISADDLVCEIGSHLALPQRRLLVMLAEGLSDREIARRLHLSHTTVANQRHKIAEVARSLGITPLSASAQPPD